MVASSPGEQDFFLDLIFAPVETVATSSSKTDAEAEAGTESKTEAEAQGGGATKSAAGDDPAAAASASASSSSPSSPPSESDVTAAAGGTPDGAAGAEAGAEAENSAVARSECWGERCVCVAAAAMMHVLIRGTLRVFCFLLCGVSAATFLFLFVMGGADRERLVRGGAAIFWKS